MKRVMAVALVAGSVLACEGSKSGAIRTFGEKYSCPEDRLTAKPSDVRWSTVDAVRLTEPPADVKADPGRLAKWKKDQDDKDRPTREALDSFDVFEVSGCGHEQLVACKRPGKSTGCSGHTNCWTRDKPGATPKK